MRNLVFTALLTLTASTALAFEDTGDSVSGLELRGLQLPKSAAVKVAAEVLHISARTIDTDYTFRNEGDQPVSTMVVLPLPDIEGPYVNVDAGDTASSNFLQVKISQDGASIKPILQQRAYSADVDLTDKLISAKVPLNPLSQAAIKAVRALPQETITEFLALGLVVEDQSEAGADGRPVYAPAWIMKSTYSWKANFPPATDVHISTSHINSLSSSVGFGLNADAGKDDLEVRALTARYCLDDNALGIIKGLRSESPAYIASWSSYRISPGGWTPGIGSFKLIVEKSEPQGLALTCGKNGKPTSDTVTEYDATDFQPDRPIDVLFLDPAESP